MSDFSNYAENAIGNHLLRNTTLTSPTTVYVALFSAVTDAEAGTGTELSQTGYARQAVTFGAPSNGVFTSNAAVTFGPITSGGSGQTASHAAIFDAVSGGNAISVIKALTGGTITFNQGDSIQIASGQLTFTIA